MGPTKAAFFCRVTERTTEQGAVRKGSTALQGWSLCVFKDRK